MSSFDTKNNVIKQVEIIWKDYKNRNDNDIKFSSLDNKDKLEYYQDKYIIFCRSFPVVLMYMIYFNQFSIKAFTKYINNLHKNPPRSVEDICEKRADYIKYLHIELTRKTKNFNIKKINSEWLLNKNRLLKEMNALKEADNKFKEYMKRNNEINEAERRQELKDLLKSI